MSKFARPLSTTQKVVDVALSVLVVLWCGLGATGAQAGPAVGAAAALLLGAAAAVRRWCPWAMVVLATLGGLVQLVTATANVGGVLALVLLFATTGDDDDRRVRWTGLGAAGVAAVGAGLGAGTQGLFGSASETGLRYATLIAVQTAVVAGLAWLLGFARHQRRVAAESRIAERIALVELAHEQDRTRIARDMHDVVAHTLAVVIAQAEGARYSMEHHPQIVERALRSIADSCRDALGDVRDILGELRGGPQSTSEATRDAALFDRMRLAGLDLDVMDVGEPHELDVTQAETVRWVLTEALTNALKHGEPGQQVSLQRTWGSELELTVSNPVARRPRSEPGHGLTGVAERVRIAGGTSTHRVEGDMFVLRARLPYRVEVTA